MDDWDMTDALIRALCGIDDAPMSMPTSVYNGRRDWGLPRKDRKPRPALYTPTLPGVAYDRRGNRLRARIFRTIDGHKKHIHLGMDEATPEGERRLHELWKAKRAELDRSKL